MPISSDSPPVLADINPNPGDTPTFTENPLTVVNLFNAPASPDHFISDPDGTLISKATVTVTGGFVPGVDLVHAIPSGGKIGVAYDDANGILILSGLDTIDAYETVLRTTTYASGSLDPTNGGASTTRTFSWVVYDEFNVASNVDTTTLNVVAINNAPTATITPPSYGATEQTSLNLKNTGLSVGDPDAGSHNVTVTLSVTEGMLNVSAGGSGAGVSQSGTATVTLTGTIAQINALLSSDGTSAVSYIDNLDAPAARATLTLAIDDGGNTGGDHLTAQDTAIINITPVNDAPTVAHAIADQSSAEDTAWSYQVPANTFADADGDTLTYTATLANGDPLPAWLSFTQATRTFSGTPPQDFNGTINLKVTASDGVATVSDGFTLTVTEVNDAPSAFNAGAFQFFAEDSGTHEILFSPFLAGPPFTATDEILHQTVTITSVSNVSGGTVVITGGTQIEFTPNANFNGVASFDYTVTDNGTTNGQPDPKSDTGHATYTITAVNDAPAGTDNTVTTPESVNYTFAAADFGFTDPIDAANGAHGADAFKAVEITTLPAAGILTDNGIAVASGQFVDASDIALHRLVFTPAANVSGAGYASFTFQVQDTGGTADGGVDLDQSPNTMTINVTHAPVLAHAIADQSSPEDTAWSYQVPANTFSDSHGDALSYTATLANGDPLPGWLGFNPTTRIFSGTPPQDFNGTIDLKVTASDGVASTSDTFSLTVTEVNDPPVPLDTLLFGVSEDSGPLVINLSALVGPPTASDEIFAHQTLAVTSVSDAVGGTVVIAGDTPFITGGKLEFTPTANYNGQISFTYTVTDNGTTNGHPDPKSATAHVSITLLPVNDMPAGTDNTITTPEDASYTFTPADFGFTDPVDAANGAHGADSLRAVEITTLPAAGTLTDSGVAVTAGQFVNALDIAFGALVFTPAANANRAGYASFTFQVQDFGGTMNGGIDLDQSPNTLTINVAAVNDAPVVTGGTTTSLAAIAEDSSNPAGDTVANLFGSHFSDPTDQVAGGSSANVFAGIAVTAIAAGAGGSWQYFAGGSWHTIGSVSTAAALLIDPSTLLRFLPVANFNGTAPALTAHLVDSSGPAFVIGSTANLTTAGGTSAYSTGTITLGETVTPVNDPVFVNVPPSLADIANIGAPISGLSISDVDATLAPGGIYEVSLAAGHGTLSMSTLAGLSFTAGDGSADAAMTFHGTLGAIDAALATASYTAPSGYHGADAISVTATDTFGAIVASGAGAATSSTKSITVSVTSDRPAAADFEDLPTPFLLAGKPTLLWHSDAGVLHDWTLNGLSRTGGADLGPNVGLTWHVKDVADLTGDGSPDIIWQNDSGQVHAWTMNGLTRTGGVDIGPNPGASWHVKDVVDFNHDGSPDILWQNDNGQAHIWTMNGLTRTGGVDAGPNPGSSWHIRDAIDLNHDGNPDILWQNDSGQLHAWTMNGVTRTGGVDIGPNPGTSWRLKAVVDMTGDGNPDIVWQNDNGQVHVWTMNGLTRTGGVDVGPNPGASWHVKDVVDYNNDGSPDILWQNDNGQVHVWTMNGLIRTGGLDIPPNPGADWHVIA